jgi:diguanylate cyclase (GGDEF)-like protein
LQEPVLSNPAFLRNKVLKGLAVALGVFALLLSLFNVYLQNYFLAALEVVLTLTCWFTYSKTKHHSISAAQAMILPYFFVLIVVYGTYANPLGSGLLLWSFTVPTVFYLLFGMRHGFYAALMIGGLQVFNILNKDEIALYTTTNVSINFLLAYITVWVISHVYENHRENAQNALRKLALKDMLTGASNRLALQYEFDQKVKTHADFSIVLMDVDLFKKVNDHYGHEAGDRVLIGLTNVLLEQLSEQQVFRLGGDEFVLLLPGTKEKALLLAEQIRQRVQAHVIEYKDHRLNFRISAGVSQSGADKSLSTMLSEADECLYQAKRHGRNQVI